MLLSDFLASQAPQPDDLVWVGSRLPSHPAFGGLPVADADKPGPVPVLEIRAADAPDLDLGFVAGRAVLLSDLLPVEPAAARLATALAEHGFQLLHAVYLDDAADVGVIAGLSVQRIGPDEDGDDLVAANLGIMGAGKGEAEHWTRVREAFANLARRYERAIRDASAAGAEAVAARTELDRSNKRISALQSSATMRVGQAAVAIARDPLRGTARSVGLLRSAWRTHRRHGHDDGHDDRRDHAQDHGHDDRPATDHGSHSDRGRLDFWAPMPERPGAARRSDAARSDPSGSDLPRSDAPRLHVDVPAAYVVARMLKRDGVGGYEPAMMPWFLALCDTAGPGAVWDVGANLGPYALLARAYSDRDVVGFEPTPDLAAWARHLARINDLDYRLEQLAAGEYAGTGTFYLSDSSDSSNSLATGFRVSTRQLDVLVEPLDRYARRTGSRPAVVKIDTETTEHLVLRGAQQVVAESRPWIFCEVLSGRPPERHLTTMMRAAGYRFFHLDGSDPLVETDVVVGDPTFKHMNYLFAPSDLDERTVSAARAWSQALAATPPPGR